MKYLYKSFLLLFLTVTLISANTKIIVKIAKNKNDLQKERQLLKKQLSGLVTDKQIRITSYSHPRWKWRLSVVNIGNKQEANHVLSIIKKRYHDAYLLNHKSKNTQVEDKTIKINFTNLSLKNFIKLVSKVTNKNILLPDKIDGKINFIGKKPIKYSKLLTLLNQILLDNGYTLQDTQNGYLSIVKSREAIKKAPPILGTSTFSEMQSTVLTFKNLNAKDIMKQAKSLTSKYGLVSSSSNNNALIITDFPENIKSIKNIIELLDQNRNTTVRFITLKNTDVKTLYGEISKMVSSFFKKQSRNHQIQLIKNVNANIIALVGDKNDIKEILPFIKRLDIRSDQKTKNIELVYIKNADAQSIAKLLNGLIADQSFNKSLETMEDTRAAPIKTENNSRSKKPSRINNGGKKDNEKPNIAFDKQLNALIIFGTQKEREVLKNIIKQLDIERKQVYVKAKILEINNEKASKIGMKYGIVGGITNSSGFYALSNKMGLDDAGAAISLANTLDIQIPNIKEVLALGVAVSFLRDNSAANIISEPSILCINNEESSLYVGKTVSVVSQSSVGSTTTDINQNRYNREDIGLTLKIQPRIAADQKVTLGIEISSEDILPGGTAGLPKTTKRVVKTSAIVKNGETIIIGGLVRDKESKNIIGLPIISNIPILGKLFQHKTVTNEKTTLVLLLTPYIIEKSADLTKLRYELGKLYTFEQEYAHYLNKN